MNFLSLGKEKLMSNRITPKELEALADHAAMTTGLDITVSNAPHYGGWAIYINNGSTKIMERDTAKACRGFLNGILFKPKYPKENL